MCTRLVVFALLALSINAPARAAGIDPTRAAPGAVELGAPLVATHDIALQRALSAGPEWQRFIARHGPWSVVWNGATASPHLAFGEAIPLDGPTDDAAQVDRAVRRFVARYPGLFGTSALQTVRAQRVGQVWYVSYRQLVQGVPVLFEDWEFRVGAHGRLMMFGADAHRIAAGVSTRPALPGAAAREAARRGLAFNSATDKVDGGESLYLMPYPNGGRTEYRLVYDVRVTTLDPLHSWITLVDAMTGEVLWRRDQVRSAISGHVSGFIHPTLPTDPLQIRPFANENVAVGATTVATDANGAYSVPVTGPSDVTTRFSGPFANVLIDGQPRSTFTATQRPDGSTVDVLWTTTREQDALLDAAERDAFYHTNVVHDFEKALDPGLTPIDFPLEVSVSTNGCFAFAFSGTRTFIAIGASKFCVVPFTSMPDVIYHEYGHITNDALYKSLGALPFGMLNSALHEGTADVLAAMVRNDPVIANGMRGPGTFLRRIDVVNRWPQDRNPDPHATGLILAAAFWDLSRSVGVDLAARLHHFAKYGLPDDPSDDGVAMTEYFLQTVVADDNDGNLANGTPHLAAINAAFDAHGIGTGYFLNIGHVAIADQDGSGPFPVTATIDVDALASAFARLDVTSPTIHYSINGAPFASRPMTPMGAPNQFRGSIPAAPGAVVHYYLDARDNRGGMKSDPPGAPADAHVFLAGAQSTVFRNDMETDPGWTTGLKTDTAADGKWVRDDPVGTNSIWGPVLQTEFDHTPDPGTRCFITGNGRVGDSYETADVDDGFTTLLTSTFSATGLDNPVIEYFRWFEWSGETNRADSWSADISNDGGASWVNVESFLSGDPSWRRVAFSVASKVTPTANMRMRFVVNNVTRPGSAAVEGALDDFRLVSLTPGQGAAAPAILQTTPDVESPLALRIGGANPSPHESRVHYVVPARGPVDLGIFDLGGRRVRNLVRGMVELGEHVATWDGLDESGHRVSSGVYFARLEFQGRVVSSALVRMR